MKLPRPIANFSAKVWGGRVVVPHFVLLILVVVAAFGIWRGLGRAEPAPPLAPARLSVTVVSPQTKSITEYLDVTGMTVAREDVQVITELTGVRVLDVYTDVGEVVSKGEPLAVLDGEALGNKYRQLRAEYDRTADALRRIEALKASGAVSQQMVIETRTAYQAAKAQLSDASLNLSRSIIRAPEAGTITERKAMLGALVDPSTPLYRIAKDTEIEVEADIPEAELSKLAVGKIAQLRGAGESGVVNGLVRLIAPRIDPVSRAAKVRIALNGEAHFPVGLFVTAGIALRQISGPVLPVTAIQTDDRGDYVWRVDAQNKVVRLGVHVLIRTDQYAIIEDIPPQSRVIARAGTFVKEGDVVLVVRP